ncbi:MAG: hypothetical protein CMI03_16210 [Oceanospirillaceae bacterium]|uniref:ATP-binding protein n=1 Tax=unclassified Thalassolituus TaxID=2624967 RepID=UPI000C6AEC44|nr:MULTISPECIES: ATP-binding protein [unclassified Thalassolituus]MBL33915.1 hypothetical protein [Oceanospirillaceae bacterium]MBS54284.1 hypothetical protein [Oceanospirillaceae bacterium]|tara:strand:+ start:2555 stop:4612 length:2058 start_codon:yes stop_codon:yes gene_type:complete
MSIKFRILLTVVLLQVMGFAALLLNYNQRAHEGIVEFNRSQVMASLKATVSQMDALSSQMERTAAGLARGGEHFGEYHHEQQAQDIRNKLQRLLLRTFASFPDAVGGGVWYEPYSLSPDEEFIGAYVFRSDIGLSFTWDYEAGYASSWWYQLGIPDNWPRTEHRPDYFYWTAPYVNESGQWTMKVVSPMYDDDQKLLGVASVDWALPQVMGSLQNMKVTQDSKPILYSPRMNEYLGDSRLSMIDPFARLDSSMRVQQLPTDNGDYLYAARSRTGLILAVCIPQEELYDLVEGTLSKTMMVNTILVIAFVTIMLITLELLFRPLDRILTALRTSIRFDSGSGQITFSPLNTESRNEFTQIIDTFNRLGKQVVEFTGRLNRTNTELQKEKRRSEELNATLEQKVVERTAELAEKNREVTESLRILKLTQKQLVDMEKHAALGDIVAGLAHEINTPLGISVTAVSAMEEQLEELKTLFNQNRLSRDHFNEYVEYSSEGISIAAENLRRAADLITRFKQVAVDQASEQKRDFELCDYINSIITSLRPGYKYRPVEVELKCSQSVITTTYPGALAQVITNLLMNSLTHAFPAEQDDRNHPGHITIEVSEREDNAVIVFRDDGQGMKEEVCQRVFNPFFTTRPDHGGSGLGAFIIQDLIINQLKGSVSVTSAPGQGTEFTIILPLRISAAS